MQVSVTSVIPNFPEKGNTQQEPKNRERTSGKSIARLEGTLLYISPEQTGRMNRVVDYRTDLYSLGKIGGWGKGGGGKGREVCGRLSL